MLKEIQKLTNSIVDFLKDKNGFSTEVSKQGVQLIVKNPNGTETLYDVYELLLYKLSANKLGGDIQLNINDSTEGKVFAINTNVNFDIHSKILEINNSFDDFKHDTIRGVFVSTQLSESTNPFSVLTMYKNGTWVRYDLTLSELLYACVNGYKLQLNDSGFVYNELRELCENVKKEMKQEENTISK